VSALPLTMAAVNYDRLRALQDRVVVPDGIDLNILSLGVEEIFYRQVKYSEFDVSEMSLSSYVLKMADPSFPFVAIPAFPSRYFRHQSMFINTASGIDVPADLVGRRVGVPEFQITAGVWQRGILADDYGVTLGDIDYFSGGVDEPGRIEKEPITPIAGLRLQAIGPDQTLSQMLETGELDAVFSAHVPPSFYSSDNVVRLFADYKTVEQDYFRRTGIFPIMHVVVVRKSVLDSHPWVARSLLTAFEKSLAIAQQELMYRSSLKVMLPWLADHVDETTAVLGQNYWTYGVESNRHVLEAFLRYSRQQGLAKGDYTPEDLFAPSTLTTFAI
jgi:4,5-dihydroxyphthalate decarboxylase